MAGRTLEVTYYLLSFDLTFAERVSTFGWRKPAEVEVQERTVTIL